MKTKSPNSIRLTNMPNGVDSESQLHYLGAKCTVTPAQGVKGVLIKTFGDSYCFRVYYPSGAFTDYELRHDDLSVTISPDALATFYTDGERNILDHSPQVLGLKVI